MLNKQLIDGVIGKVANIFSYVLGTEDQAFVESALLNVAKDAVYDAEGNFKPGVSTDNADMYAANAIVAFATQLKENPDKTGTLLEEHASPELFDYQVYDNNGSVVANKRTLKEAEQYATDNGISMYNIKNKNGQVYYDPENTVAGLALNKRQENPSYTGTIMRYYGVASKATDISSFNKGLTDEFGEVVDNLPQILSANSTLLNMWNSLQEGVKFFTFDDFKKQLVDTATGSSSFTHKDYSHMMSSLLGENWLGQMLNGTYDVNANMGRYATIKEDTGVAEWIGTLSSKYTGLSEVLNKLATGTELTKEEQLALAQSFINEGVTSADQYTHHIQDVTKAMENMLSPTAAARLSSMGEMFGAIDKYQRMLSVSARNSGRSGKDLDSDAIAMISEITTMDEQTIKELGSDVIQLILDGINESANTGAVEHVGGTIAQTLVSAIKAKVGSSKITIGSIADLMNWDIAQSTNFIKSRRMTMEQASMFASATGNTALQQTIARAQAKGYTGDFTFDIKIDNGNIAIDEGTIEYEGEVDIENADSLLDKIFTSRQLSIDAENEKTKTMAGISNTINGGT